MPPSASSRSNSANLSAIYQELLTTIVRLRSGRRSVTDTTHFRGQFREALNVAVDQSRRRGYSDDESRVASFAVVAFLDESVLNLRTAAFSEWVRKPLQEELFGVHMGGEVYFQNVERLMREPESPSTADLLEIYLLCVLLGYSGKYGSPASGDLRMIAQSVLARIRRIRQYPSELSPAWRPPAPEVSVSAKDRHLRAFVYAAVFACLMLGVLFASYRSALSGDLAAAVDTTAAMEGRQ